MPRMIQLRHVPDELHRKLKARASLEGLSLSDRVAEPPDPGRTTAPDRTARARFHPGASPQGGARRAGAAVIVGGVVGPLGDLPELIV